MNRVKISLLGGDTRQFALAAALAGMGFECATWALPTAASLPVGYREPADGIVTCADPVGAVNGSRAVILPLPATLDGVRLHIAATDSPDTRQEMRLTHLFSLFEPGSLVLAGRATEVLCHLAREHRVRLIDYYEDEALQVKNAIPTAEGALELALRALPVTLHRSRCTVLGFGRIGERLAACLHALGAEVCVVTRRLSDLARAEAYGYGALALACFQNAPPPCDVLFNTVPAPILHADTLAKLPDRCPIIELASAPGCVDAESARRLAARYIRAASLPGKVAPFTAGRYLGETVGRLLGEEGILP